MEGSRGVAPQVWSLVPVTFWCRSGAHLFEPQPFWAFEEGTSILGAVGTGAAKLMIQMEHVGNSFFCPKLSILAASAQKAMNFEC